MSVVKKIKLNSIENGLEEIVSLSSRIKISQEELLFLDTKIKENTKAFSEGALSESRYKGKEKSLQKERKKLEKNINFEIKRAIRKIEAVKKVIERVEI
ncbi:MAG: hypothetical protein JW700_01105 [Candidatus Aenigmarchaeota archaeon]|nr:hypothetical protein [Candidatus Aenigmarchaeota archaeon]